MLGVGVCVGWCGWCGCDWHQGVGTLWPAALCSESGRPARGKDQHQARPPPSSLPPTPPPGAPTPVHTSNPPPSPGLSATLTRHAPASPTPPCLPPPRQKPGYPPGYPHPPCQSSPTHTPALPYPAVLAQSYPVTSRSFRHTRQVRHDTAVALLGCWRQDLHGTNGTGVEHAMWTPPFQSYFFQDAEATSHTCK